MDEPLRAQPTDETDLGSQRRWGSFRLRTLLIAMLALGLLMGAIVWRRDRAARQAKLVADLQSAGAAVLYDYHADYFSSGSTSFRPDRKSQTPDWLLKLFGQDFFHRPEYLQTPAELTLDTFNKELFRRALAEHGGWKRLYVCTQTLTAEELALIGRQEHLRDLAFDRVVFADPDLNALSELDDLRTLYFSQVPMKDCDLDWAPRLRRLKTLSFWRCELTDEKFQQLRGLPPLEDLIVTDCEVGSEGLAWLAEQSQLTGLRLADTAVDDRFLPSIEQMSRLSLLDLTGTGITGKDGSLSRLPPSLEVLMLSNTAIEDCDWLKGLPKLTRLAAARTQLTVEDLRPIEWRAEMVTITLQGVEVDDAFLQQMTALKKLQWLTLTGEFSEDAELELYQALPKCRISLLPP